MFQLDPDYVLRCSAFEKLPWLQHGFGTRLSAGWPPASGLTSLKQVHSNHVVATKHRTGVIGEGDALISREPGTFITIRTADCLPILIVDVRSRAVSAVHAGWKGTVSGICVTAVQALEREYGSQPADLMAAIGPGIGPCCFEVGPEVAAQFGTIFPERNDLAERTSLDLAEANVRQLCTMGLDLNRLYVANICTCCATAVYDSYRRDRAAAGRMTSGIGTESG